MISKQAQAQIEKIVAEYNAIGGGQVASNSDRVEIARVWYGHNHNQGFDGFGCWIRLNGTYGRVNYFFGKSWSDAINELNDWVLDAKRYA